MQNDWYLQSLTTKSSFKFICEAEELQVELKCEFRMYTQRREFVTITTSLEAIHAVIFNLKKGDVETSTSSMTEWTFRKMLKINSSQTL